MAQATVTRETALAAREAALGVNGVAGLDGGRVGEVALLLPGERVEGLKHARSSGAEMGIEAHIVFDVSSGRDIESVAQDVRGAILDATDFEFVDVVVADAVDGSATSA